LLQKGLIFATASADSYYSFQKGSKVTEKYYLVFSTKVQSKFLTHTVVFLRSTRGVSDDDNIILICALDYLVNKLNFADVFFSLFGSGRFLSLGPWGLKIPFMCFGLDLG
jgi:hypothetical protein